MFREGAYQPKPEERLQAQAESFADKGVKEFSDDQAIFLKYSAELSQLTDLGNIPQELPDELKAAIAKNKRGYVAYLRRTKKEEIDFREQNIRTYKEQFQPAIQELKVRIAASENPKSLPEYLGSGSNGSAYKIEMGGVAYAAKFSSSLTQSNFEIKPLIRAKGIENVAQLEAYSFEDGVVIMDLLPGQEVTKIKPEKDPGYTDEQITAVIAKVQELDEKGLVIDPKASNFLYDKEKGFSILDFHLKQGNWDLPNQVISLRNMLSARDWKQLDYDTPEYDAQAIEQQKITLAATLKLLTITKNKFPDIYQLIEADNEKRKGEKYNQLIQKEYLHTEDPDVANFLRQIEELGF